MAPSSRSIVIARAETAPATLVISWGDWTRHLQAARRGKHRAHGQVGQPQVVLLPTYRDDHGEATKVGAEGVAVDGEGSVVFYELEHMGLACDLQVLGLAIEEERHLVHHIPVQQSKHSPKTEVWSHLTNLDCWRSTVDEHISLACPNSDPDQGVEESFMPNTVHPEFSGGAANLHPVGHSVQDQLRV